MTEYSLQFRPDVKHSEELTGVIDKKTEQRGSEKYPSILSISPRSNKTVLIIIASMFCEHLCDSGLRSIMSLYFRKMLDLEGYQITIAVHSFNFLKYFAVLIGAILADSYFGKIKTILFSQLTYSTGTVLLTMSSIIKRAFPNRVVLGLAMLTNIIGLGGILPCLIPLAADQLAETKEQNNVKKLFIFYFVTVQVCNIASVLFVPMIKEVPCLGLETCYPLAFGVPAALSIVSIGLFLSVCNKCVSIPPRQPTVCQGVQCCLHSLRMKIKKRKEQKKSHWLDYADDKFDINFIEAVKCTLSVFSIPIPLYWSLYDQQSTTWTMQASRMDTEIGPMRILPDQVQVLSSILFFTFIPLLHYYVYNMFTSLKIFNTYLRRMVVGGFLITLAFLIAFAVELRIEHSRHLPNKNDAEVRVYNGLNSGLNVTVGNKGVFIKPFKFNRFVFNLEKNKRQSLESYFEYNKTLIKQIVKAQQGQSSSLVIVNPYPVKMVQIDDNEMITKDSNGFIKVRVICSHQIYCRKLNFSLSPDEWFLKKERNCSIPDVNSNVLYSNIPPGIYRATVEFKINAGKVSKKMGHSIHLKTGGTYCLMVHFNDQVPDFSLFVIAPPNSVSVLWMIPQYVVLSISGVLFIISAYSFIYTETPDMFKSFSWTACFMTLSVGNMVTVIVGGTPLKPAYSFLLFTGVMFIGMFIFIYASSKYKYVSFNRLQPKSRVFPIK